MVARYQLGNRDTNSAYPPKVPPKGVTTLTPHHRRWLDRHSFVSAPQSPPAEVGVPLRTSLSRDWLRSAGRVAVVTTLAAAALSLFAGSASAHTPTYGVNCDRETGVLTVWIKADSYQDSKDVTNKAVVKDGDKTLLDTTFKSALEKKTWELDGTVDHKLTFDVDIVPDPNKPDWELHEVENVKACKTETTKPTNTSTTTTTTPSTTVSTTPSSTAPTTASTVISPTTTVAPNPNDLPDTGSNVGVPLAIGGLLVLGGGGALVIARRKRSSN